MFQTWMAAYPWDVMDEGVEAVLDRLRGEVGVTGLALWAGVEPVTQLRTREVEPRVFRTRGGLFFQPDEKRYGGTRCKPVLSTWLKGRNPLSKIAKACADRGLELRVIVSAAATGRIAQRHPEMACKNLFAAESQSSVCLTNPDVQTYLCSLAADLSANDHVAELSLADFRSSWAEANGLGPASQAVNLQPAAPLGETERTLLALCFCESCHQKASAADVDVTAARGAASTVVHGALEKAAPTGMAFAALLEQSAPLAAYVRWQGDELSSLLRRVKEACTCALLLDRSCDAGRCHNHDTVHLAIPDAVISLATGLGDPRLAARAGLARTQLRLPETLVIRGGGTELVSTVAEAAQLGLTGVQLDNYGLLPPQALTAIRQAVRFARRTPAHR